MHEAAAATPAWVLIAYLIAGICFILALRGLSSPASEPARQPPRHDRHGDRGRHHAGHPRNRLDRSKSPSPSPSAARSAWSPRKRIQMTAMPQLVAAFHSLVGMAAVLVGAAAFLNPERVRHRSTRRAAIHRRSAGSRWGSASRSARSPSRGSVIAFLKLNGNMSGAPILLPLRHVINLGTLVAILGLIAYFTQDQAPWVFWTVTALSLRHRLPADHPDRRGGHAGRGLDAQQLFGLGGGGDGLHARTTAR